MSSTSTMANEFDILRLPMKFLDLPYCLNFLTAEILIWMSSTSEYGIMGTFEIWSGGKLLNFHPPGRPPSRRINDRNLRLRFKLSASPSLSFHVFSFLFLCFSIGKDIDATTLGWSRYLILLFLSLSLFWPEADSLSLSFRDQSWR